MNKTYETKKHVGDKIALLGLLVAAFLIARLIIIWRSAIVLSDPIKLNYTGLSLSVPVGKGWQTRKQWKYQENGFTLSSVFVPGAGGPTGLVSCRYLLAAAKVAADMRFKQKASAAGGTVAKTGQTRTGKLTFDWAYIKNQKTLADTFFGTARLPNNRQLDIEVYQATGDTKLAEGVFKRIAESLKFKENPLLEAGSEIITKIKSKGLSTPAGNKQGQSRESFFLIKDAERHTIGFTMDVFIDSGQNAQLNIQAASFLYVRGRFVREEAAFFQSDNRFDEFTWKSETSSLAGRTGTEIALDKAAGFTVKKFSTRVEEKTYQLSPAAIPDVFLEQLFSQLLDSSHKEIIVDIIKADGKITPVLIYQIEAKEEAAYVLRVELLNGRGFSEQVYLDDQRQISRRLLGSRKAGSRSRKAGSRQEGIYTLERTSAENIVRQFPERADYILQKNKMLQLEQSQQPY